MPTLHSSGCPGGGPRHCRLFARNLRQVASCLHRAGIPAVLIQVGVPGDHVGASIDLVIPGQHWRGALTALADWYVPRSTYQLSTPLQPCSTHQLGQAYICIPASPGSVFQRFLHADC